MEVSGQSDKDPNSEVLKERFKVAISDAASADLERDEYGLIPLDDGRKLAVGSGDGFHYVAFVTVEELSHRYDFVVMDEDGTIGTGLNAVVDLGAGRTDVTTDPVAERILRDGVFGRGRGPVHEDDLDMSEPKGEQRASYMVDRALEQALFEWSATGQSRMDYLPDEELEPVIGVVESVSNRG